MIFGGSGMGGRSFTPAKSFLLAAGNRVASWTALSASGPAATIWRRLWGSIGLTDCKSIYCRPSTTTALGPSGVSIVAKRMDSPARRHFGKVFNRSEIIYRAERAKGRKPADYS